MGRGKTKMELIRDEKSRNQTFKRRKRGLIQKLHELTTLCDVSACMILYGEDKCETWPENVDEINRIIGVYKASGNIKKFDMSKLLTTKAKMESRYPTSLEEFLTNKAALVKSRINELRRNQESENLIDFGDASSVYSDQDSMNQKMNDNINHHQLGDAFNPHFLYDAMINGGGCGYSEPEPTMIAGDCGYLEMIAGGCGYYETAQMVNGDYYSAAVPPACIDDVFQEGVVPGLENQSDMGSEVYYIG